MSTPYSTGAQTMVCSARHAVSQSVSRPVSQPATPIAPPQRGSLSGDRLAVFPEQPEQRTK